MSFSLLICLSNIGQMKQHWRGHVEKLSLKLFILRPWNILKLASAFPETPFGPNFATLTHGSSYAGWTFRWPLFSYVPKRSMYENQPNVGKCTIHGFWKDGNIQFEHGSQWVFPCNITKTHGLPWCSFPCKVMLKPPQNETFIANPALPHPKFPRHLKLSFFDWIY